MLFLTPFYSVFNIIDVDMTPQGRAFVSWRVH
jgi:hypothetical protein